MASYARRLLSTGKAYMGKHNMNATDLPELFQPPINRSMQTLDRSFFRKVIPLAAASISDVRNITSIRKELEKSKALLRLNPIKPLRDDETTPGAKCFLLQPGIHPSDKSTWPDKVSEMVDAGLTNLRPYDLTLTYDDWTMHNILEATLPDLPEEEKETPAGFALVGHVAHVNLRTAYLPYKNLIGQILLDKNPTVKTVINKTLDVGESIFRTFPYEVLAGADDLDVIVHEAQCEFRFNFGKVYWNTRLGTEHARLFESFKEGEAVCDVMAGVGPFAIPAGRRKVFVRANDLNPDSYKSLQDAIGRNKVQKFVTASCQDGREFIRAATKELANTSRVVNLPSKIKISRNATDAENAALRRAAKAQAKALKEPGVFSHYVMNLPATAIEFLDAFKGTYQDRENEFEPHTAQKLPLIHVYLFQTKYADEGQELREICERVSHHLGAKIELNDPATEIDIRFVRLVAPKKKMFCASVRLPAGVAFGSPQREQTLSNLDQLKVDDE